MSEIVIKRRSKQKRLVLTFMVVILAAAGIWAWTTVNGLFQPVDVKDTSFIEVAIPDQANAGQIASLLVKEDLIRSQTAFLLYCRHSGLDNQLKAGKYKFSRSQSLAQIADIIAQGHVTGLSFTIPEGFTVKQIGDLLAKKNICTAEEWQAAAAADYDYDFLREVPVDSDNPLEGFLFPDTYDIGEDTSPQQIVNMMLENFADHWEGFAAQADSRRKTVYDTIILASIIEKEAQVDNERRLISGVIQNRLRTGMMLQLCPTVLYCIGKPEKTNVSYEDTQVDSPYNTYKYPGLPPGPISCPGAASIAAALNPQASNYYYYVAKGDGSHYFSRTYAEHLQAQRRYSK